MTKDSNQKLAGNTNEFTSSGSSLPRNTVQWTPYLVPTPGLSTPFAASLKKLKRLRRVDQVTLERDRRGHFNRI